ncbi:flagellar basal body-associated FliL family protein [Chitinimonas sp.]|uniref:flagellar basal body-associated FliL family protein n=1 Tax=Chitinimonas sp. TaxID=1934313 RepID=UPI002F952799
MAEAKKPAPAAEASDSSPKGKKNTILYIVIGLLILVILAGGAFGTWLFLTISANQNFGEPAATAEQAADDHGSDEGKKEKKKKDKKKSEHGEAPVFTKLDTFTVNLATGAVLQTEIHVQVADEKQSEVIKSYLPRLSSQVNLLLSSKKQEEISTLDGKVKLMEEIKQTLNKVLGAKDDEDGVMSVEFKTFIVQ